jgi:WD40 repeat protein
MSPTCGEPVATLTEQTDSPAFPGRYSASSLTRAPSGRYIAAGFSNGIVQRWQLDDSGNDNAENSICVRGDPVQAVTFSPIDDTLLAFGFGDGEISLWDHVAQQTDSSRHRVVKLDNKHGSLNLLAFSPDGQRLASDSDGEIFVWNVKTRKIIAKLAIHHDT